MQKISAGLLMYRKKNSNIEVFLVHPGGPFFKNKDESSWSIPKGKVESGESLLEGATREFKEETGINPKPKFEGLGNIRLKSGKIIHAWAFKGDWNGLLVSNYSKIEWPRKSGNFKEFPEADKAQFFSSEIAKKKIHPAQAPFIDRLVDLITNRNNS